MISVSRLLVVSFLSIVFLAACDSGNRSETEIEVPESLRQIAAIQYGSVFADISVDGGAPQTFRMTGSSSVVVSLQDVLVGESYDIQIDWYEQIDGVRLNLARQSGAFEAAAGAVFSAEYVTEPFNIDGDGFSNHQERVAGTCPWLYCAEDGQSLLNPEDVTVVTTVPRGTDQVVFTRSGDNQWQEVSESLNRMFNWSTASYSRTSIFLVDNERCSICDPYQGWLMEINLVTGDLIFDYNDGESDPLLLYSIEELEF